MGGRGAFAGGGNRQMDMSTYLRRQESHRLCINMTTVQKSQVKIPVRTSNLAA